MGLTKKKQQEIWDEGANDDYIADEITNCALLCINDLKIKDNDIDEAINIYADGIHGSNEPDDPEIIKAKTFGVNDLSIEIKHRGVIYAGCLTEKETK